MRDNKTARLFKFIVAAFCATLIFMTLLPAVRYRAIAETEPASEAMPMRSMFIFADYDPAIDEVGNRVQFGEGYFFLKGDIETYVDEGNNLDFRRMAEDHGHIDDFGGVAGEEITADMVPESGSNIAIHGARSDSDCPYIHGGIFAPTCIIDMKFHDSPEDRTLVLEDGSRISPLMAKVILYYLETSDGESARMKARFLRLKQWGESANTDVKVLYNSDTELATWDDVDGTPIVTMGNQFWLGATAKRHGFVGGDCIEGGGVSYYYDDRRLGQTSKLRVYGSWDDAERPYFEAQLGNGVSIWMSFPLTGEIFVMENGSKIPERMARAISLAMSSLAYYPEWFEVRFDALDKTAPTGVLADVYLRTKTDPEEAIRAENPEEQPVVTNFSDGWISTQGDIAAYMSDGYLDLRTLAHDQKWRVDPATTEKMTLLPQTNNYGYMVLSSYSIEVYGVGEYTGVLISGPWYRISVKFDGQLAKGEQLVKLENGDLVPERAGRVVLKALEILNGEDSGSIYETFEELKETCPNGVTITMNRFT